MADENNKDFALGFPETFADGVVQSFMGSRLRDGAKGYVIVNLEVTSTFDVTIEELIDALKARSEALGYDYIYDYHEEYNVEFDVKNIIIQWRNA